VDYSPIRKQFASENEVTQGLIRRKRTLSRFGGTAEEWLTLAEEFLADDGRANYAFCMYEFKRHGGHIPDPIAFIPEPVAELFETQPRAGTGAESGTS
jgi:hypothetical protein